MSNSSWRKYEATETNEKAEDAHWKIVGFYWINGTFATWQKEKTQKSERIAS